VDVMERALGTWAGQLIGVFVAISSLTSMNSTMIVGARTNYALAHDWPALGFMGQWQGERNTPAVGFIVQAAIALALIVFGALEKDGFATMVEFTAPVFWFFFMLSGIAVFVLRRKDPGLARPFKVPLYPVLPLVFWFFFMLTGIALFVLRRTEPAIARPFRAPLYPLLPAIFVLTCAYLFYSSVMHAQSQNAGYVALGVMATGAVVLLLVVRGRLGKPVVR
jgi:basic amino acid/polyamine antiporter, APA family